MAPRRAAAVLRRLRPCKKKRNSIAWIQLSKDIKDEHPVLDLDLIFLTGEQRTGDYGFLRVMAQEAGVIFGADEIAPVCASRVVSR